MKSFNADEFFDGSVEIDSGSSFEKISLITPTCKGVIFFCDHSGNAIQLLTAGSIRRTVRARLFSEEQEQSKKRARLNEIVRKIYYKCCWCDFETSLSNYEAARGIWPSSYKDVISLAGCVYLKINASAKWPFYNISEKPASNMNEVIVGPFANRNFANLYKDAIVSAFGLCRRTDCVDNAEKAKSCPYLQMGLCDGACVGRISKDEYLKRINRSVKTVVAPKLITCELNDKMKQLSSAMKFEQAGAIKTEFEQLKKKKKQFRWIDEIGKLSLLHIDKAEKVKIQGKRAKEQLYHGFLIKAGHIYRLEKVLLENVGKMLKTAKAVKSLPGGIISEKQTKEQLCLVSYFLYKSNQPGVWFKFNEELDSETVIEAIKEKFEK